MHHVKINMVQRIGDALKLSLLRGSFGASFLNFGEDL